MSLPDVAEYAYAAHPAPAASQHVTPGGHPSAIERAYGDYIHEYTNDLYCMVDDGIALDQFHRLPGPDLWWWR
ncbi:hypothetical protein [Streptomyces sp. NPDC046161]|uniref:hypothetical protein n=1 Tax=Streptomyces sp. NPDC046161 TaxID=3155132 RepID=UPI0033ED87B1